MYFNPDKNNQAQEFAFQGDNLILNILNFYLTIFQLVVLLSFLQKAEIGINIITKLNNFLPQQTLLTIYKSIVRTHLHYGDIIYD